MHKRIVLWISMVVTSIALLIVGATIMFNRAQPSEKEIAIAGVLVPSAKRVISNPQQTVFYEASRDAVIINAYGFMETDSQRRVIDELRAALTNDMREVKIKVLFFPPREYLVERESDGRQVSRLKKMDAIRQIGLN